MKKSVGPMILVILLTFVACYFVASEFARTKAVNSAKKRMELEEKKLQEQKQELEEMSQKEHTDTVVVIEKDEEGKTLTLQLLSGGNKRELTYTNTTKISNKYGNVMSIEEITRGELIDITYDNRSLIISEIQLSKSTFTQTDITNFSFDEKRHIMTIAGEQYELSKDVVLSSFGKSCQLMDFTEIDTITVKGCDRKICSVTMQKGHGYLRLMNDAYFIGGWVEVGQAVIKKVTGDMLIPVPEGTYEVKVSNRGYAGTKELTIERDKETLMDLDEIEIKEVAISHVQFSIRPDFAQLYIDDEITEFEELVPLEYGIHNVRVEAAGYEPVNINIKVVNEYANVDVELDLKKEDTSSSTSASTFSTTNYNEQQSTSDSSSTYHAQTSLTNDTSVLQNTSSSTVSVISEGKRIKVENPKDAEVYLDGNYIGIAPVSTQKVTGSHVITLSRTGYVTRSYTVQIEDDEHDVNLSFSELVAQ